MTLDRIGRRRFFGAGAAAAAAIALGGGAGPADAVAKPTVTGLRAGSRLDPHSMQILFADLQIPLVSGSKTTPPADLTKSAAVLAKIARILAIPIHFSVVPEGNNPPHLLDELRPYSTTGNTILRTPVSPFHHAPTVAALSATARRTLVIAGYAAEAVVLQSALDALAAGYQVLYVVDAVGSQSARTEGAAFRDIEAAGAVPTSVLSLATRLVNDFITSPGKEVFAALQPLLAQ